MSKPKYNIGGHVYYCDFVETLADCPLEADGKYVGLVIDSTYTDNAGVLPGWHYELLSSRGILTIHENALEHLYNTEQEQK